MCSAFTRAAVLAVTAITINFGFGAEARAQHSRRTPIVEAVSKTRAGIVTVKVEKNDGSGRSGKSVGTGVIVDDRGFVVSNRHVVANASRVTICLHDGSELEASVLVEDPATDLSILRVRHEKKLLALPLGPGSDLLVGETVIAVGHPFGYTNTVSTGIVSALGREITMPSGDVLSNLIQTDASINPGNSGGPLLNINGELIGINVALREGAQGIAFAINSDTVKQALIRHLSANKLAGIEHGLDCSESVAPEGKERQHVILAAVGEETPAAAAGLKKGDTLIRVAAYTVANRFDVERAFWDVKPGEKVDLKVVRQGKEITVNLMLTSPTVASR